MDSTNKKKKQKIAIKCPKTIIRKLKTFQRTLGPEKYKRKFVEKLPKDENGEKNYNHNMLC